MKQKPNNSNITIHFIGIGGIGMSGIAEIMLGQGFSIQGSDIANNENIKSTEILIQLGNFANQKGNNRVLLSTRMHLFFRGLSGIFACINPACNKKLSNQQNDNFILGKLVEPTFLSLGNSNLTSFGNSGTYLSNILPNSRVIASNENLDLFTIPSFLALSVYFL